MRRFRRRSALGAAIAISPHVAHLLDRRLPQQRLPLLRYQPRDLVLDLGNLPPQTRGVRRVERLR